LEGLILMSDQQGPWSSPQWPPQGQTNQSGYPGQYTGQNNQPTYPGQYQGGQPNPYTDYSQPSGSGYPTPPSPYEQAGAGYPPSNPYGQPQYGQVTYPSQPPVYPPSMPPRKKNTGLWIALSIIAAIVILPILFCVGATSYGLFTVASKVPTVVVPTVGLPDQQTPIDGTATPDPGQSGAHHKVGQVVTVNNEWEVTINSAKFSQTGASDIDKPAAGKVFLVIDITLKNISPKEQNISSLLDFKLRDKNGQSYNESIFANAPDGKVEPGGPIKGQLEYEVSPSIHQFTFYFDPDFTSSNGQTIWDITA